MANRFLEYFASLVASDEGLPLTEAAVALAQDAYPDLDVQGTLTQIDGLAARLAKRLPADAGQLQKLQLLDHFFFRELGFSANQNDYYDPDNSHLHVVLDRRRGIPISLAVLCMEIGQQIGLPLRGLSFPGHFLMRLAVPAGDVVIDPLSGQSLSPQRLLEMVEPYLRHYRDESAEPIQELALWALLHPFLEPASPREILARMLRNLRAIYTQSERWERVLAVQERMVLVLPDAPAERRDRGLAYARLNLVRPAQEDLEFYLSQRGESDDADAVRHMLDDLSRRPGGHG
ncbi:transglutaminase [Pandoraea terrae]|uniref:Transglutaminase n=1 Tax=Pandoraea terrae TaxID=1537710 RepID=A0A5E4ZEB2_9BURK|nr:tetratricopeptide repeat protein [Pandoraea terrae]VVE59414.1 transglutaminase [Pandoraea terrae]